MSDENVTAQRPALSPIGSADVEKWLPIETAPKDGTEILAYSEPGCTNVMLVRHIAMVDFLTEAEIEKFADDGASLEMLEEPDWFAADFVVGDRLSPDCYPTHWMPLPEIPSLQRAALAEEASSEAVTSEPDTPAEAAP